QDRPAGETVNRELGVRRGEKPLEPERDEQGHREEQQHLIERDGEIRAIDAAEAEDFGAGQQVSRQRTPHSARRRRREITGRFENTALLVGGRLLTRATCAGARAPSAVRRRERARRAPAPG